MFQTEPGNGRIGVWQLDESGLPVRRYMDLVIGKSSSLATNKALPPSNSQDSDRLIAKGLPTEFIEVANERLAAINAAYDKVEKIRGLK